MIRSFTRVSLPLVMALCVIRPACGAPNPSARYLPKTGEEPKIQNPNTTPRGYRAPTIRNPKSKIQNPLLAVITFRPAAEVRGGAIHLCDVARIESARSALIARLGAVEIGAAPLWGYSRPVSAAYARVRIRQIGLDPDRIRFVGPDLITVTRPEQILAGAALAKAAREAVEAANPGAVVEIPYQPRDLHLPVGAIDLSPQLAPVAGGSAGIVSVQVMVDHRLTATMPLSFRVLRLAPAVIARRDLPVGTVLTADDLQVEDRPVVPGPLLLSDPAAVIGQQVALPIQAGSALTAAMVKPAILVRRGAPVRLICKGPGFVATVAGEALEDGAAGQLVRCRNLGSLREVTGIVTGDQTAEVPF